MNKAATTQTDELHILSARAEIASLHGDRARVARICPAVLGLGRSTPAELNAELDLEAVVIWQAA